MVFTGYFDQSNDIVVHCFHILSRYPPLGVLYATDPVYRVVVNEGFLNLETRDVTGSINFHVPLRRNLPGILLIGHSIENGLFG